MSIRIKKLSLAGYRSYGGDLEANTIDFRDINVIIGANGAGKSNLISFIEMIAYMMTGGLKNYIGNQGGASSLFYFGVKETDSIQGRLEIEDENGKEDVYRFSLSASVTDQLYYSEEIVEYHAPEYPDNPYKRDLGSGHFESAALESADFTVRTLCQYLRQLRVFHFNDTTSTSRIRRGGDVSDCAYFRSDGGNVAAFLYELSQNDHFIEHYDRIVRYIRMVTPQFDGFYLAPQAGEHIKLRWKSMGSDALLGAHHFSDGSLRFIALAVLLLQPPDLMPSTIILDEPEIGLHPYALSVLAQMIRVASKNSQVIISTQSSGLLDYFGCEDIITAEYDVNGRQSTLRRHTEEDLKDWVKEYSLGELWEKNVLGGLPL